jgi:hypothetical protein
MKHWKIGAIVGIAVGIVAVVGVAGVAADSWFLPDNSITVPGLAAPVATPSPDVLAVMGVLRRPRRAEDALPDGIVRPGRASEVTVAGGNAADSRRVQTQLGDVYVLPANNGVCAINVARQHVREACGDLGELVAGQITGLNVCAPDLPVGTLEVRGLLPDGSSNVGIMTKGGKTAPVEVSDNVVLARVNDPPLALRWTDAQAKEHTSSLPSVPVDDLDCKGPPPGSGTSGP